MISVWKPFVCMILQLSGNSLMLKWTKKKQQHSDPVVIWWRRWSNIRATRQWWKVLHISATKRSTSKEPLSIYKNNIFMRWVRVKESSLRISSGFSWAWLYGWQVQTLKKAEKKLFSSSINVNKTRRALEAFLHYLEFLFYFILLYGIRSTYNWTERINWKLRKK